MRVILTSVVLLLFVIYLLFDIDYLIVFNVAADITALQNPELVVNTGAPDSHHLASTPTTPPRTEFNTTAWHYWRIGSRHCPYFEDICVHKRSFYVHDQRSAFRLHPDTHPRDLFGDKVKHSYRSFDILSKAFAAKTWAQDEYQQAQCLHDTATPNHIILADHHLLSLLFVLHIFLVLNICNWPDR